MTRYREEIQNATLDKDIQNLIKQAQHLIDATSGELDEGIKKARTALMKGLDAAKDEYGGLEAALKDKVLAADDLIRLKPYHAIGGTFLAGLLLGWLMSRK